MNDDICFAAFLEGPVEQELLAYVERLSDGLLRHSGGALAHVDALRTFEVDEDAFELIVVQTISVRISGPKLRGVNVNAPPARRARRAGRGRGGRAGRNGKVVRH